MHILPTLDEIEKKYDKQVVVVGVHTAKFETEKDTENIRNAIMRYEIHHPVINDAQHILWNRLQIGSWPTLVLLDPQGRAVWANAGEIDFGSLDNVMQRAVAYYQRRNEIDTRSVHFALEAVSAAETPLRFPGKILADEASGRLFISDTNHNRIVISDLDGKLVSIVGSGKAGARDGDFANAEFNHPQGLALNNDTLFVADTENHLLRSVDLKNRRVTTIAGTGKQARDAWFGAEFNSIIVGRPTREPLATDLASPWDLLVHGEALYIAMAGTHQLWSMDLQGKSIGPFAGNGREDIVDGPLMPRSPYALGTASFAQPSGLATDGKQLYVADSEGSSIRAVPAAAIGNVTTVVGTAKLSQNRLFVFGNQDGSLKTALFQHPLGVAYGAGKVFVADTYNNKIREIDLVKDTVSSIVGNDEATKLNEPSGLSLLKDNLYIADTNHHRICVFNLKNMQLRTLDIVGLNPPLPSKPPQELKLPLGAVEYDLAGIVIGPDQTVLEIPINYLLPDGWKLNEAAPQGYVAIWKDATGKVAEAESIAGKFVEPGHTVTLKLKVPPGTDLKLQIGLTYYFCRSSGEGLCLAESANFTSVVTRGSERIIPPINVNVTPMAIAVQKGF